MVISKKKTGLHLKLEKPGHFGQSGGTLGQGLKNGTVPAKPERMVSLPNPNPFTW